MNLGYIPQIPWSQLLAVLFSGVILLDFGIGITGKTEEITRIVQEKQQYYNPAQNSHYAYRVVTGNAGFYISEEAAGRLKVGDQLILERSFLFREVNGYKTPNGEAYRVYSLRMLSGFVIPLLVILTMVASIRWKANISTLTFVMQVLLVGDLIYLAQ